MSEQNTALSAERVALPALPEKIHPHQAVTVAERALSSALFTGLVRLDAHGHIVAGIAESWSINLTGEEYRFTLRTDAAWSDGKRIDAESVVKSLEAALDPATAAPFYASLLPIKNAEAFRLGTLASGTKLGVRAPDAKTVVITLDRPSHQFLKVLASPIGAPIPFHKPMQTAVGAVLGNGPYVLGRRGEAYVLRPRGNLSDDVDITNDPATAQTALGFFTPVSTGGRPALYQMLFNLRKTPFNERDARHAFGMVIDREALISALELAGAKPAYSLTAQVNAPQAPYVKLKAADRKTVAEALLLDAPRDRVIRIVFPDAPDHHIIASALAAAWRPLGFKVDVQSIPISTYEHTILSGAFDVAWAPSWVWGAERTDLLFPFSQAAGPWNAGGYQEPAFDQYLASADVEPLAEGRENQLRAAEDLLMEDQPSLPLFFYSTSAPQTLDIPSAVGLSPQ